MRGLSLLVAVAVLSTSVARADEPGDRPLRTELTPRACNDTALTTSPKPIYTRWYFWTSVGVSIAATVLAGVAVAAAATTPPPYRRTEADICAGGSCNACVGLQCATTR